MLNNEEYNKAINFSNTESLAEALVHLLQKRKETFGCADRKSVV